MSQISDGDNFKTWKSCKYRLPTNLKCLFSQLLLFFVLFRFLNTFLSFFVQFVFKFDQLHRWNILKANPVNRADPMSFWRGNSLGERAALVGGGNRLTFVGIEKDAVIQFIILTGLLHSTMTQFQPEADKSGFRPARARPALKSLTGSERPSWAHLSGTAPLAAHRLPHTGFPNTRRVSFNPPGQSGTRPYVTTEKS